MTVSRYGGNLADLSLALIGVQSTLNEDGSITIRNVNATIGLNFDFLPNGKYTFKNISGNTAWIQKTSGDYLNKINIGESKTVEKTSDHFAIIYKDQVGGEVTYKLMVSATDHPINYEKYIEPTIHTSSADGTVTGMKSVAPNMTILTDTEGVNITATYNADTKKYIDKKFEALNGRLAALEGASTNI